MEPKSSIDGDRSPTLPSKFEELHKLIVYLRSPEGCSWDRAQTEHSLRHFLIEETFEYISALEDDDKEAVDEELGDILLVVMMIVAIREEAGKQNMCTIIDMLIKKLIRRHPHIFSDDYIKNKNNSSALTPAEVKSNWDRIKNEVEGRKTTTSSTFAPRSLAPLSRAFRIQKRAAKKGFDWDNSSEVITKILEEVEEVQEALGSQRKDSSLENEIGDLLFSVVNLARSSGIDPNIALHSSNEKFLRRFSIVEQEMHTRGLQMNRNQRDAMEHVWESAKDNEKRTN